MCHRQSRRDRIWAQVRCELLVAVAAVVLVSGTCERGGVVVDCVVMVVVIVVVVVIGGWGDVGVVVAVRGRGPERV